MSRPADPTQWRELTWQRPLDPERVAGVFRQWATDHYSPTIVIETEVAATGATYRIGWPTAASGVAAGLRALGSVSLRKLTVPRGSWPAAGRLAASTRHRPLRVDDPLAAVRAILALHVRLKPHESVLVQLVLGPRRVPLAVPNQSPSSVVGSLWSVGWHGDGGLIDGEKRRALRLKVSDHGFACTIRLGVRATDRTRRTSLMLGLLAALRVSETPGLQLRLRPERPSRLVAASAPWRWPLRLGVPELVGLTGWPLGDEDLPGLPAAHPRPLPPTAGTTGTERVIAEVALPGASKPLALPVGSALQHLLVTGPTGVGKSTLLANLIIQDWD